ncbi:efflux RND transporter periplasmic adaptor subunit [Paraphotobacterium marinum]|uniref:efflux RND transporter periplasmic adaptor subunit n=2 Tax=Paraphotobacterium marinum TaxID=1755811 RepID=UPI0039ED5CA0
MIKSFTLIISFLLLINSYFANADTNKGAAKTKVVVQTLESTSYQPTFSTYGDVKNDSVKIKSSSANSKKILGIYFKNGTKVKKGDLLIQLDNRQEIADLAALEAEVANTKFRYESLKKLYDKKIVSLGDLNKAKALYLGAKGRMEIKKSDLQDLEIRAPISGVTTASPFHDGDVVTTDDTLLSIYSPSGMYVEYSLPAYYKSKIKLGEDVALEVMDHSQKIKAQVSYISPDISDGMITVQAAFDNNLDLYSGEKIRITQTIGKYDVYAIPQAKMDVSCTIFPSNSTSTQTVKIIENGTVVYKNIKLFNTDDIPFQDGEYRFYSTSGTDIKPGSELVLNCESPVFKGSKVEISKKYKSPEIIRG